MDCPCENCICVPVCKHKRYFHLTKCEILQDFIDDQLLNATHVDDINNAVHRKVIHNTLKPTAWVVDKNGWVVDVKLPMYKWCVDYSEFGGTKK